MRLDEFDVELTGTREGSSIVARGSLGDSSLHFQAKLTKHGELPEVVSPQPSVKLTAA